MKVLRANGGKVLEGYMDEMLPLKHGGLSIDVITIAKSTKYKLVLSMADLDFLVSAMAATEQKQIDMGQAHHNLLHYVLSNGGSISVCDPNWKKSEDERIIKSGIESLPWLISEIEGWDGGQDFYVIEHDLGKLNWVGMAMGYGNEPHETIHDFAVCPMTDEWFKKFFKEYCNE